MPDVGMADYQMTRQKKIIQACEKWWPREGPHRVLNKSDCSGFVRSVAIELKVPFPNNVNNANDIYFAIHSGPWSRIGFGSSAAHLAGAAAANGKFVIGANYMKGAHGHVIVVVDMNQASSQVPFRDVIGYWGKLNGVGKEHERISLAWRRSAFASVIFAAREFNL